MKRHKFSVSVVLVLVLSLFLLPSIGSAEGVKISVLTMTGPWISGPVKVHGEEWAKKK